MRQKNTCITMQLFILFSFLSTFGFSQNTLGDDYMDYEHVYFSKEAQALFLLKVDSIFIYNLKNYSWENNKLELEKDLKLLDYLPVATNNKLYIIEKNGGKVFELNDNFSFIRIDKSFTHKMQTGSTNFVYKNKIYRYGGYGFWSVRNFSTYFDFKTNEWEMEVAANSKEFPQGSINSNVLLVKDEIFVYGGTTLNQNNPLVYVPNNELWKYDFVEKTWQKLELIDKQELDYKEIINYKEKDIHIDDRFIKLVDFKENKISYFKPKAFHKKLAGDFGFESFYFDGIFYCFEHVYSSDKIQLKMHNEEEFFGELIKEKQIYKTDRARNIVLSILGVFALLLFIYLFRERYLNRNKIYIKKDKIIFKGKSYEFDAVSHHVLNLFLKSEENVKTEDIMGITENNNLHYAHNIRVKNQVIEELNFKLKSILEINHDLITIEPSEIDKRIKVYTLDKSYFVQD